MNEVGATFRYKDYRRDGAALSGDGARPGTEFIRRFLLHVLARGFHRIRHYGLFASAARKDNLARAPPVSGRAPTNDPRFHRKWRRFGTMAPLPVF